MIKITEELINSVAPNSSAIQNGLSLVKKDSFVKLFKNKEETLIFGECLGSGKSNYSTSADFIAPENPIFRCSCPSRQIPCKHSLGLMYAYLKEKTFEIAEIPEDILSKREKIENKETKKKEAKETGTVKKVNKTALAKKIKMEIEGLELAEKITYDIIRSGLAVTDSKTLKILEDQAKQLGNYYLTGVQSVLRILINYLSQTEKKEELYTKSLNLVITLNTLSKKGKDYLVKRLEDSELKMDTKSNIEEALGHIWLIDELTSYGLIQENVELIQLYFNSFEDIANKEFVDLGIWINMNTGKLNCSINYRPFKAAKHIKEDDSFFSVLQTSTLYVYPGEESAGRVRWDDMTIRDIEKNDYINIKKFAKKSFAEALKEVKNQMKNPLLSKSPEMLLSYSRLGKIGDEFIIEDEAGKRIILKDSYINTEKSPTNLFQLLNPETFRGQSILLRFAGDLDKGTLWAEPLSIITDNEIIRLVY